MPQLHMFSVVPPKFRTSNELMHRCCAALGPVLRCFRPAKTGGVNLIDLMGATKSNAKHILPILNLNILASQVRIFHPILICSCSMCFSRKRSEGLRFVSGSRGLDLCCWSYASVWGHNTLPPGGITWKFIWTWCWHVCFLISAKCSNGNLCWSIYQPD